MIRMLTAAAAALCLLAGCVNAENEQSQSHGGSKPGAAGMGINGDVTADAGGAHTVNGSVHVPGGQKSGDVGTVNGSIHIDSNAVLGDATTVNGAIGVGAHSTAESLETVNGEISLDDGARVVHAVQSVNGSLRLNQGADVGGGLTNVNGPIEVVDAHVGGGITTVDGDIDVGAHSRIDGGILVKKPSGGWFGHTARHKPPRIVIGPGAVVKGDLRFEQPVQLYVSDTATIGPVSGANPVKFSGASPPS